MVVGYTQAVESPTITMRSGPLCEGSADAGTVGGAAAERAAKANAKAAETARARRGMFMDSRWERRVPNGRLAVLRIIQIPGFRN